MAAALFALLVPDPAGDRLAQRHRLADAVAVTVALGYGLVMLRIGDGTAPGAAIPWPVDVLIGMLCAVPLLVRRRWPVAVLLALLPFGAISVTATGPILVAIFTAAVRRRARLLFALGAAHVGTGVVYFLLQNDPPYPVWVDVVLRAVTGVAVIGWGQFVQAYRRLTESLRSHAARLEAEQHLRVDQARLTERARIAREMHDVLAHRMSLISLHAGALEVRPDARPDEITIAAGAIRSSAHEALEELRAVVGVAARPEPPQPGLADVPDLVASARAAGMRVEFADEVTGDDPPTLVGRTAYRITQEALTNARRHGGDASATVRLVGRPGDGLRIVVVNPSPPTVGRAARPGGIGLVGIGERVALAGGRVTYGVVDGTYRLEAWLPWPT
ncbi:histidine kinase [Micromonospora sp. WMMD1120]|uniref:sensor histidine kinase n=1 Tax=Micromonospora sp. WMMD1120 TaxID=3016106 RepID=UPI002415A372|nr:histidine kinase [Micromonospora sp. WMMD1120]MDG4806775.1 histidine kinase [Micromonospora sp. WMMD1120]